MNTGLAFFLVAFGIGIQCAGAEPACAEKPSPPSCRTSSDLLTIIIQTDAEKNFENDRDFPLNEALFESKFAIADLIQNRKCLLQNCSSELSSAALCMKEKLDGEASSFNFQSSQIAWEIICETNYVVRVQAKWSGQVTLPLTLPN